MSKYRATKCVYDNIKFDSLLERDCYLTLKKLYDSGAIAKLDLQQKFPLVSHSGKVVGNYIADFLIAFPSGKQLVVEAKGVETPVWRWKRKHYEHDYSIPLLLIKREDINKLLFLGQQFQLG